MSNKPFQLNLSPTLRRLLVDLQEWCTVDCCKQRAFTLTEEAIAHWLSRERINRAQEIREEISDVCDTIQQVDHRIYLDARDLRSDWAHSEFQEFWLEFMSLFKVAAQQHLSKPST